MNLRFVQAGNRDACGAAYIDLNGRRSIAYPIVYMRKIFFGASYAAAKFHPNKKN